MSDSAITGMEQRLAEIARETNALNEERRQIESALEVARRYIDGPTMRALRSPESVATPKRVRRRRPSPQEQGTPRPNGIPSIWDMTEEVLKGAEGLELQMAEIVDAIRDRWWPGVHQRQIAPTIYRFAREDDGRLARTSESTFTFPRESASAEAEKTEAESAEPALGFLNSNHAGLRQ